MNEQVHPALREPLNAQIEAATVQAPDRVTALIELAINRNVPMEVLERLVALKERVEERDARKAFFDALAKFQEECPKIPKSRHVGFVTRSGVRVDYDYAPLDEVARVIRAPLKACGLSYSWNVHTDGGKVLNVSCVLRHIDGHEDRSTFPVPVATDGKMSDAQANGAALTYGKRQSLLAVLGLTTAEPDMDGVDGQVEEEPELITEQQAADLRDLIEQRGGNEAKFLKFYHIEKVSDLPARKYKQAVDILNQRVGR